MDVELRCPSSEAEFQGYFHFRWRYLRGPWGQPPGSERDEMDQDAFHVLAMVNGRIVGVGRIHGLDAATGQIRYMAVSEELRNKGIGRRILAALEDHAEKEHWRRIVMHAREEAVGFYAHAGYRLIRPTHRLFGAIQHYYMEKDIRPR